MKQMIVSTSTTIRKSINHNEIVQALHYCYKIIGLSNIPSVEDESLLIQKLKEFHGNYQPSEIKLAFDFAIQKKYDSDVEKHFHNFSVMYMNNVLNAYSQYRAKESALIAHNRQIEPVVRIDVAVELAQKEFDENIIHPMFELYEKTKSVELGATPVKFVYKRLVDEMKVIDFTREQKIIIRQQVEANINDVSKFAVTKNSDPKSLKELMGEEKYNLSVVERCQLYCVKLCFDKMIEDKNK